MSKQIKMREELNRFKVKGNQQKETEDNDNKPHHHKISSEPFIKTNSSDFAVHKIRIFPKEDNKLNFYPLIIKNKRIKNTNDLYTKLKDSHQYQICSKMQISKTKNILKQKSQNFELLTESTTSFKFPPIKQSLNSKSNAIKSNRNLKKSLKPIKVLNEDSLDSRSQNRNQMVDVLFKDNIKPNYHYVFPSEYEKIKINDNIRLYKNKLTMPTQADIRSETVGNKEGSQTIPIRSQRYKNTYYKPKKLIQMPKPKKLTIERDEVARDKKLKEVNDSFIQKYQHETKKMVENEIDCAIYTKEMLSNGIDLMLKHDAEEFNKIEFNSADD